MRSTFTVHETKNWILNQQWKYVCECVCVSCITYLFILIFSLSWFFRSLVSSLRVPFVEWTPAPILCSDRAKVFTWWYVHCTRVCVCASFLLFSSRFMWSSSCRAERSGNNGGACAAYGVCVLREMPVAPMYELVRCTHFTIAVCSYTYISMSRCRKFTLRLLYKGRQVPCRSHIRTCLRRANNSLSFSWVLWKLEKFENSKIRKYKPSNFHFSFKQVNQNWCKRDTKSAVTFNQ